MTKRLIFLALAATLIPLAVSGAAQAQQNCRQIGAEPVALTGMVSSLQASGPPGYGQTPKEDAIIQVPIMQLSPPLCVDGAADGGQQNLNSIQLVFQQGGPQFQTEMTGTSFMASGTLAPAQGPEHLTPVVLMVENIEQVMDPVSQGTSAPR
ncbi:MAG: hypothetical protein AB7O49_02535 [Sphingomonadales bacterium]